MVATINLPGSSHFRYFIGTRAECGEWLKRKEAEYQERFGGTWYSAYSPGRIISNTEARKWRYRDGSRVIREFA